MDEKQRDQQAGENVAQLAGKGAATYFGGAAGATAYDKARNAPVLGNKIQNLEQSVGSVIAQNPKLNQASRMLNDSGTVGAANQALGYLGKGGAPMGATDAVTEGLNSSSFANNQMHNDGMNLADIPSSGKVNDYENIETLNGEEKKDGEKPDQEQSLETENNEQTSDKKEDGELTKATKKKIISTVTKFIVTNPGIIAGLAMFILVLFIIVIVIVSIAGEGSEYTTGAGGYQYFESPKQCSSVTITDSDNTENVTVSFDEYILGVALEKAGEISNEEVFKVFIVSARTYAMKYFEEFDICIINDSEAQQFYMPTSTATEEQLVVLQNALSATNGAIMKENGTLVSITYSDMKFHEVQHLAENGFTWEEILNEYYPQASLGTIYGSNISNLFDLVETGNVQELGQPLDSFLAEIGTSIGSLNSSLYATARSAGLGTREAVVRVTEYITLGLANNYNIRLPYTFGGHHGNRPDTTVNASYPGHEFIVGTTYGFNAKWGHEFRPKFLWSMDYMPYSNYGPDCSGFISWITHNAGYTYDWLNSGNWGTKDIDGKKHTFNSFEAQPGDLIWRPGHIMIILGVDKNEGVYFVAHAASGERGVRVDKFNMRTGGTSEDRIIDMTHYYETRTKASNYPV